MVRTDAEAAELARVLLAMVEGAIAAGDRGQVVEVMTGQDVALGRGLPVLTEWNLATLHVSRLELLAELAGADPEA